LRKNKAKNSTKPENAPGLLPFFSITERNNNYWNVNQILTPIFSSPIGNKLVIILAIPFVAVTAPKQESDLKISKEKLKSNERLHLKK